MNSRRTYAGLHPFKRHGLILTVAGLMYAFIGCAYIFSAPNEGRNLSLRILLRVAPIEFWGGLFVLGGILSIISSRWPPFTETWGYMVLTGLSSAWGTTYLLGIVFGNASVSNINAALIWELLAFLWWAISGLTNPTEVVIQDVDARPT